MNRSERRQIRGTKPSSVDERDLRAALDLFGARRYGDADLTLRNVLMRNPRFPPALQLAGAIAHALGRFDEAVAIFRRAVAVEPDNPRSRNNLGLALLKQGSARGAAVELRRAAALSPEAAEIHANLGKALHAAGDLEAADLSYAKAIALNPRLLQARCDWAVTLYVQGKVDAAIAAYEAAIAIDPSLALARHNLGRIFFEQGDLPSAEKHLRRYLEADPTDRQGARFLLAAMGREQLPARTSEAFLERVYAERAQQWDALAGYDAHRLVADALARHANHTRLNIADVGCGTGLVGELIRSLAQHLDGVDLSAEMLAVAAGKDVYDALHRQELTHWLLQNPARYDAIVSAATLIHFGELRPVFKAAAAALRPGGLFVFTLLAATDPAHDDKAMASMDDLALGGCYLHGRAYVETVARETGLAVGQLTDEVHEVSGGKAVPGLLVVLRSSADRAAPGDWSKDLTN